MIKEVTLLVGGAAMMALFLTPEAKTNEREPDSHEPQVTTAPKAQKNVVLDEDAYWEYDNDTSDDIVFGEPMVDADAGAIDNEKTMFKKAPSKAASASGRSDRNQEYPKPLV